MRDALQLIVTLVILAWAYALIAVIQLPNASQFDPDPYVGRVQRAG